MYVHTLFLNPEVAYWQTERAVNEFWIRRIELDKSWIVKEIKYAHGVAELQS